jgi:hypothetical protein
MLINYFQVHQLMNAVHDDACTAPEDVAAEGADAFHKHVSLCGGSDDLIGLAGVCDECVCVRTHIAVVCLRTLVHRGRNWA